MAHSDIENHTLLSAQVLGLADETGSPIVVSAIKGTWQIASGALHLLEQQQGLNVAGQTNGDEPDASYRIEPETAFFKPSTDVVLVGHAYCRAGSNPEIEVGLKVGPVQKIVRVLGDRYWVKTGGQVMATRPQPFERIPLVYERAFGGWDKSSKDEKDWRCDFRNPVGRGFGDPLRYVEDGKVPMPNIEDPKNLIKRYGDTPPPAGFGFVSPHWQPRAQYAGTYDEVWDKERKPLLPSDFDRRFFNAASPGLIAPRYLKGDEDVVVVNASPIAQLRFKLPGLSPPMCRLDMRSGKRVDLQPNLDTVIIDTDDMLLFLVWRAYTRVPNGPHDVVAIEVTQEQPAPRLANG